MTPIGMTPIEVELQAMLQAKRYLEKQGYEVQDVRHTRGHNGYDLLAHRSGKTLRIEVKGCTRPWGIPDLFHTEFDSERKLVADFLYVVYFLADKLPHLCAIPRSAIDPSMVKQKISYVISKRFKNEPSLSQFVIPLEAEE